MIKNKRLRLIISSILFFTTVSIGTIPLKAGTDKSVLDNIYEEHNSIDLSAIEFSVLNNQVIMDSSISPLKSSLKQSPDNIIRKMDSMLQNEDFKTDFIKEIKLGRKPMGIGIAEAEFEVTKDLNGNVINKRPLTVGEVKYNVPTKSLRVTGQTQSREKLSLYTFITGTSPNYWVQANAYWSMADQSKGWEACGITWDNSFYGQNNASAHAEVDGMKPSSSTSAFKARSGIVWSFTNGLVSPSGGGTGLKAFYGGISVKRDGAYGVHSFTSEYIHTYKSYNWSANISANSSSQTGASITLSSMENSWKLVSWYTGKF